MFLNYLITLSWLNSNLGGKINSYLADPTGTTKKIFRWLNAKWQLRQCNYVGSFTRVEGKILINNSGEILIGKRVQLISNNARSVLSTFPNGVIEIGDRSYINYGADIAATNLVKIGSDCHIGTYAIILDNDFHMIEDRNRRPDGKPVIICNKVWIGNRVIVLPGVTIGENSVIGAGSVVVKSIPADCVAAGNPARIIREL